MRRDYSDSEVRALILYWLVRHGRWGAHYFPLDTLINKLSHAVRKNGKRIRKFAKKLTQDGYLLINKGIFFGFYSFRGYHGIIDPFLLV